MEKEEEKGFFDQKEHEVLSIALSNSFIALGTPNGYKIYTLNPIKLIKDKDMGGGIRHIGFYNQDKIIWFVGGGNLPAVPENEFRLWDNHNDEELCKVVAESKINSIKIKSNVLAVVLSEKTVFHNLPLSDKYKTFETATNPYGVIAISPLEGFTTAAYLGEEPGTLIVYDYAKEELQAMIEGNSDEEYYITALELNSVGSILACATSEGCTVHLYDTKDGTKLRDYTRGSAPSTINFISFQLDDTRLLISSEAGTIHIFMNDITQEGQEGQPVNDISVFSFLGPLIPYLGKIGSYCKFRTPELYKIAMMPSEGSLIVLSSTGKLYLSNINVEEGGEAILDTKKTLTDCLLVQKNIYLPKNN
ncbi:unnamed protein product [Moneuplotes crassus]|uniref:Uncharacterized protein n=1 Tax=Euplotes crassus TaxID=5936 RepID=A0AAD1XKD5_EUPCR|nr:unnamed protein product [Moneuplotes crassus]